MARLKAAAQAYRLARPTRPDLNTRKSLNLYYRVYGGKVARASRAKRIQKGTIGHLERAL